MCAQSSGKWARTKAATATTIGTGREKVRPAERGAVNGGESVWDMDRLGLGVVKRAGPSAAANWGLTHYSGPAPAGEPFFCRFSRQGAQREPGAVVIGAG